WRDRILARCGNYRRRIRYLQPDCGDSHHRNGEQSSAQRPHRLCPPLDKPPQRLAVQRLHVPDPMKATMTNHVQIGTAVCAAALSLAASAAAQSLKLDAASVSNAASYISFGYPNGGISHGGMFIVKAAPGSAPLGACGVKVADKFPIATSMNGTSMRIT